MSELEKVRAGVFLSLLTLTLTWLLIGNGGGAQSRSAGLDPVALCASTHGALCEVPAGGAVASATEGEPLGSLVVTAPRAPADLGHIVVVASPLPEEPLGKVQLASAKRSSRAAKSIVAQ